LKERFGLKGNAEGWHGETFARGVYGIILELDTISLGSYDLPYLLIFTPYIEPSEGFLGDFIGRHKASAGQVIPAPRHQDLALGSTFFTSDQKSTTKLRKMERVEDWEKIKGNPGQVLVCLSAEQTNYEWSHLDFSFALFAPRIYTLPSAPDPAIDHST
jgi:hypothetical protein